MATPINPNTAEVIPILRVTSASAAVEWYAKLGFKKEWEHRFEPHLPAFVEISNGSMRVFLTEHTGDANFGTTVYFRIPDVDEFVKNVPEAKVEDTPYGMREVDLKDPDGNWLRIGSRVEGREGQGYS